jgi:four helix bundle protein
MATIHKFEDLEIWRLARILSQEVFVMTSADGLRRDFALKDQINRSSGSIMDNIAEGYGRGSRLEFIQFLSIAAASADELRSQLYRCLDRAYISQERFEDLHEKSISLCKKINGFIKYLNGTLIRGTKFKDRKL